MVGTDKFIQSEQKIVALGITVLRAIESAWDGNQLRTGHGLTNLKIIPGYKIQTVNALITGMHEVGTSHMNILDSICPINHIRTGYSEAEQVGYRSHEYGDLAYLHCRPPIISLLLTTDIIKKHHVNLDFTWTLKI